MEQTIELRIVDPKTLIYADKRDPRQVPADRLSDAALKANSNAIGFVQPPLFSEQEDGTLIHSTAIKVLQTVLNCRLAYGVGSGLAARIAGEAIGADVDLPHMGTEEFLSCLSRAALEDEASRHRVLPRARVKDTRAALIEQVRETRLVLPAAQFALTEHESSDFAKKGSRYAYGDASDEDPAGDSEGDETANPSATPDDRELGPDEAADLPAGPEETGLDEDSGDDRDGVDSDHDDLEPLDREAADRADAAYEAHV